MVHWVYVLQCEDDRIYVGETKSLFRRLRQHISGSGSKCTQFFHPIGIIALYNISKNIAFENYRNDNNITKLSATFNLDWKDMYKNNLSNLDIENYITECFMDSRGDEWWKVSGGKYTKLITTKGVLNFDCNSVPECLDNSCSSCVWYIPVRQKMEDAGIIDALTITRKLKNCEKPQLLTKRPKCLCGYPAEINIYEIGLYYTCPQKNTEWIQQSISLDSYENCNFYEKYNKIREPKICFL